MTVTLLNYCETHLVDCSRWKHQICWTY